MEGIEIRDIMDLVKKADINWREMRKKREQEEKAMKERLAAAVEKEAALQKQLSAARAIAEGMEKEYLELEKKIETETKQAIESRELTEKDVKEGRVSITEFYSKGKKKGDILAMTIEQTLKELEQVLETIRAKNKEILELELEIYKQHQIVFSCSLYPGRVLEKAHRDQADFILRETSILFNDQIQSDSRVKQKEHELNCTEGRGLSAGYTWGPLTWEQAHSVIFDPIFPKKFIPELEEELQKLKGTDQQINILHRFGFGAQDPYIDVSAVPGRNPKTKGKIFEKKNDKIRERQPIEKIEGAKY